MSSDKTAKIFISILLLLVGLGRASAQEPIPVDTADNSDFEEVMMEMPTASQTPHLSLDSMRVLYPAHPIAALFAALPDKFLPLLSQRNRLDMIDYALSGSKGEVKNSLTGKSWVDSISADYIRVRITAVSSLEMALYKGKKEIVAYCYTISPKDAAADSELLLFDTQLAPLPIKKYFKIPGAEAFIEVPRQSHEKASQLASLIPFPSVTYQLMPQSGLLKATLTVADHMLLENENRIKPYLHPTLTYNWDGRRFALPRR